MGNQEARRSDSAAGSKINAKSLMLFVFKKQKLMSKVVTDSGAVAFVFLLHRRFEELGMKNYLIHS